MSDTHDSESPVDPFQPIISETLSRVRSICTSHKREGEEFTYFGDAKRARTTSMREKIKSGPTVTPDAYEKLKDSAEKEMVQRVFENGLYPKSNETAVMANAALDTAIGPDDGIYFYFIVM